MKAGFMDMFTQKDMAAQLDEMGLKPTDTLLVHSSMKAIGCVESGADGVVDLLMRWFAPGLLILPTHTWDRINLANPIYDPQRTDSCVGLLTNIFRQRSGVSRSWHPTHSVAAFGKDAADYTSGEEKLNTPCPRHGCWGKLIERKAKIVFIGCNLQSNTFLHGVEEWNNIPGRLSDSPLPLKIRRPDGSLLERPMYTHAPDLSISDRYDKVESLFSSAGIARYGSFAHAQCIICDAAGMDRLTSACLAIDPHLFLDDRVVPQLPV